MLSLEDLAGFDLPALRAQVQHMAVRQDRYRREAQSIGVSPDCPETYRLVQVAEQDAAALAHIERLLSLTIRFAADDSSGRPAPTHRFGRRPSRAGFLAHVIAALTGTASRSGGAA
ncbi:hypothetical protein FHR71_001206 [Methylobacterium sp. RAS18]|nr:hypothetical protein [Methylobacterium sp. RAS18]